MDHHLVPALPAVDEALEQRLAGAGDATGAVAIVFGLVVGAYGLHLLKGAPVDIGRVLVFHADLPLIHRQDLLLAPLRR